MTASLRGRFCAHGIEGSDYCPDCYAEQVANCDHLWAGRGFSPDFGPSYECSRCGAVTP